MKNIFKAFDNLLYLIFCELGTYPDDETGYFGHMSLPPCGQTTYTKPTFLGGRQAYVK